jgi:hypothetical protein
MDNPCKQCIVQAMCQVACDVLLDSLKEYLPEPELHNWQYGTIAKNLRTKEWRLTYVGGRISGVTYNV